MTVRPSLYLLVLIGVKKIGNIHIVINGQVIALSSLVTNLGVTFDPFLSFEAHIKRMCLSSFFHQRKNARLRSSLKMPDAEKLMHAFISSMLDYCNSPFIGLPAKSLQKLQYVHNSVAQVSTKLQKIELVLASLHWLPVKYRIELKNLLFVL